MLLVLLGVLLGAHPASAAPATDPAVSATMDTALVGQVFGAALAFVAPRTLDPHSPGELAVWGLRGMGAIDSALTVAADPATIRLLVSGRAVRTIAAPAPTDATAWGDAAALIEETAFAQSSALRAAGQPAVVQGFFDEMFSHLDPYSRYIPPVEAADERDRLSGEAGAGLGLTRRGGAVVVADVVPGGPGALAGVRVGDRLLSVDGTRVSRMRLDRVDALLAAPEGVSVMLRLLGLDGKARTAALQTALVPPETVTSTRDGNLLLVRVSGFAANTAERLSQVLDAGMLDPSPPTAVAIDLRGNRGGLLRQAVTAVALLLEQGTVARTAGRAAGSSHAWQVEGGDLTHGLPVIVLVDGRTASAAEIMAAALADLHRGVVVGSATLGKGLVQTITPLPDGGEIFVTWSRVLAPLGWPLQGIGVLPQLCTSLDAEALTRALHELTEGRQPMQSALEASRAARAPVASARIVDLRAACPAAEGTARDLEAAHFLADHTQAYQAGLLAIAAAPAPGSPPPL